MIDRQSMLLTNRFSCVVAQFIALGPLDKGVESTCAINCATTHEKEAVEGN